MTQPELPLTVHEYGEWGDPADPAVLHQVRNQQDSFIATPTPPCHDGNASTVSTRAVAVLTVIVNYICAFFGCF